MIRGDNMESKYYYHANKIYVVKKQKFRKERTKKWEKEAKKVIRAILKEEHEKGYYSLSDIAHSLAWSHNCNFWQTGKRIEKEG